MTDIGLHLDLLETGGIDDTLENDAITTGETGGTTPEIENKEVDLRVEVHPDTSTRSMGVGPTTRGLLGGRMRKKISTHTSKRSI